MGANTVMDGVNHKVHHVEVADLIGFLQLGKRSFGVVEKCEPGGAAPVLGNAGRGFGDLDELTKSGLCPACPQGLRQFGGMGRQDMVHHGLNGLFSTTQQEQRSAAPVPCVNLRIAGYDGFVRRGEAILIPSAEVKNPSAYGEPARFVRALCDGKVDLLQGLAGSSRCGKQ